MRAAADLPADMDVIVIANGAEDGRIVLMERTSERTGTDGELI